jgi:hypothetical protein
MTEEPETMVDSGATVEADSMTMAEVTVAGGATGETVLQAAASVTVK